MNESESNKQFLQAHSLPESYLDTALCYYEPVAQALVSLSRLSSAKPVLVSLSGCQGSGKSTLADYLAFKLTNQGVSTVTVSLDDFYLSKSEREQRANTLHPLFKTRGVPGTHNTQRLISTLLKAKSGELAGVSMPRFNKATDDLFPESEWTTVEESPAVFILEGWCLGAEAVAESELSVTCNEFEKEKDADGQWRRLVNEFLKADYQTINSLFDVKLFLRAPGFGSVFEWRLEQEQKLQEKMRNAGEQMHVESSKHAGMTKEQVKDFIQYYQRITEHLLGSLSESADVVWQLDENRRVVSMEASAQIQKYLADNNNELNKKVD